MYDLTAFQRDLLWLINRMDKPKGVEVREAIEEYYGTDLNHGRLYPNLDELADKGLIEKGKKDERTNEYGLSQRGRRELEARLSWEVSNSGDIAIDQTTVEASPVTGDD